MPMIIEGPEYAFKRFVASRNVIESANKRGYNNAFNRASKTIGKSIAKKKQIERTSEKFVTQNAFKNKPTSLLETFRNIFRK